MKTDSVAKIRQLLDDHPFQSTTGRIYTAPIVRQTEVVPLTMISPSGRRMCGSRPSEAQNRTLDEMEEQIEAVLSPPFELAYTAPIMNQAGAVSSPPFELKSFKIGSLATTREFIDVHPFQSMNQPGAVPSPSNRPMRVDDMSRPQARVAFKSIVYTALFVTLEIVIS